MKQQAFAFEFFVETPYTAIVTTGCLFKTTDGQVVDLSSSPIDRILNYLSVIGKPKAEGLGPLYEPQKLVPISLDLMTPYYQKYLVTHNVSELMQYDAYEKMVMMLSAARASQINLYIHSAYRSYVTQCSVFSRSLKKELSESSVPIEDAIKSVNVRSAKPGQSEHQLGTVADLVTYLPQYETENNGYALKFELQETPAFQWLTQHASEYGYALSYPRADELKVDEENPRTGYKYEPWHWRYIGVENAKNFKLCPNLVLREYLKKVSMNPQYKCP